GPTGTVAWRHGHREGQAERFLVKFQGPVEVGHGVDGKGDFPGSDAHGDQATRLTIFRAASAMLSPETSGRPESASVRLPAATLLPSRRTTSGSSRPTSLTASTTPSAMTLQSMMPPKML